MIDTVTRAFGALCFAQQQLEFAISACPSGKRRNLLTELNILTMATILEFSKPEMLIRDIEQILKTEEVICAKSAE